VKLLIDRKADVKARDAAGKTPLHEAARGGHGNAVRAILAAAPSTGSGRPEQGRMAGADVNAADKKGATPLKIALGGCHEATWATPEHWAASHKDVVELLRSRGGHE
jgi:ankyrin repeat protein